MAFGIPGGANPARIPNQAFAQTVVPQVMQALSPQVGQGKAGGGGFDASTPLSELKPEQLTSLGGGALETIAQSQPGTTVGELGPFLRNRGALDTIANLMQDRRDLKVGDFVTQDNKGRSRIDPSYKDPKTLELLKERPDITPGQLSAMKQNMTRTLKNPQMGKAAAEKGFELLKKRSDLQPEDMGKMLDSMKTAVGGKDKPGGGGDEASAAAALDMFDSASKMMEKRTDIKPEAMGQLAQSVGNLSSPKDKNGPQNIAEGFESASKSLEKNALRGPQDMAKMAGTMGDHFAGGDEKSARSRMNAFKQGADMMGENQSVDHNSLNKMLTQATERDPKIKNGEGGSRNQRLAKVMDNVATGVKQGTVSANDLSSHFRNQDAERARFKVDEPKTEKKGEEKKAEDKAKKPQEEQGTDKADKPKEDSGAKKADATAKTDKPESADKADATARTDKPQIADKADTDQKAEAPKVEPEEEGAKPHARPGEGPNLSTKEIASAGPGEAAGTTSAGTPVGTAKDGSKGGAVPLQPTQLQIQPKGPQ